MIIHVSSIFIIMLLNRLNHYEKKHWKNETIICCQRNLVQMGFLPSHILPPGSQKET